MASAYCVFTNCYLDLITSLDSVDTTDHEQDNESSNDNDNGNDRDRDHSCVVGNGDFEEGAEQDHSFLSNQSTISSSLEETNDEHEQGQEGTVIIVGIEEQFHSLLQLSNIVLDDIYPGSNLSHLTYDEQRIGNNTNKNRLQQQNKAKPFGMSPDVNNEITPIPSRDVKIPLRDTSTKKQRVNSTRSSTSKSTNTTTTTIIEKPRYIQLYELSLSKKRQNKNVAQQCLSSKKCNTTVTKERSLPSSISAVSTASTSSTTCSTLSSHTPSNSNSQSRRRCTRLYNLSWKKQLEGKKRREKIHNMLLTKQKRTNMTNNDGIHKQKKKITLKEAERLYYNGVKQLLILDSRRYKSAELNDVEFKPLRFRRSLREKVSTLN